MASVDELADRLRREADRVNKQANWLAGKAGQERVIEDIRRQLEERKSEEMRLQVKWEALWALCTIDPISPREMFVWLDELIRLRDGVERLHLLRQHTDELERTRDSHIQALKKELQVLGEKLPDSVSLEEVLSIAEQIIDLLVDQERQRLGLDEEIRRLELGLEVEISEHQSADTALEEWRLRWSEAVAELGLGADALPSEVADVLEKLRMVFVKLSEAEKLQVRIRGVTKDGERFRTQVESLVKQVAPELTDLAVEHAVVRLNVLLGENRTRKASRQQIEEQVQQIRDEAEDAAATVEAETSRLQTLCREAQCADPDELVIAECVSSEHRQLNGEIDSVVRDITEVGEGATLTALEEEAEGVDPDALPGQIEELAHKIEFELVPGQTELAGAKGRGEKELELMDGSDQAADLAQQAQAVLASIQSGTERYMRVKLAAQVLRQQIDRYRRENEGPLIKRAGEYFAVLTTKSFESLCTDLDEKGDPVLLGLRPDGNRVGVEGMSSGTRDQLYLSLRLASLEKYMETSEPMPFIVDDILVQFDDERSEAALKVLGELSQKMQVILFTHHSRLVEQAQELGISFSLKNLSCREGVMAYSDGVEYTQGLPVDNK